MNTGRYALQSDAWRDASGVQRLYHFAPLAAVLVLHAAVLWLALQFESNRVAIRAVPPPLMVSLIAPPEIVPPQPQPPKSPPKPVNPSNPKRIAAKPVDNVPKPRTEPERSAAPQPNNRLQDLSIDARGAPSLPQTKESDNKLQELPPVDTASAPNQAPSAPAAEPSSPITPPNFNVAYLDNPPPVYPAISRRMGEGGTVLLRVYVSGGGHAEKVEIKASSGSQRLDGAAMEAVRQWQFVPAKQGDQAVSAWVLVPISFNLEG